jgi:hypothetical protein
MNAPNPDKQKMLWYNRRYARDFFVAWALYVVIIVARHYVTTTGPLHTVFMVLPIIPIALILVAMARLLVRLDEMERLIHLYAYASAALITAFFAMAYSFLEQLGAPRFPVYGIFPIIIAVWGIALAVFRRHFSHSALEL